MLLPYATDKIFHAISGMACSPKPIQKRVYDAWIGGLHVLQRKDFKGEELAKFIELEEESTRVHAKGDEGDYAATLLSMTDEEAEKHVNKICSLYYSLVLEYQR